MADLESISLDEVAETVSTATVSIGSISFTPYLIFKGLAIICLLLWLTGLIMGRIDRRLKHVKGMRASNRTLILKIFQIVSYCIILIVGMHLLGINMTALSVFSGALGVGLGFGLQKIASNFISGIILLFEKSVEVGDLIQLADGTLGTIRQTQARYTLIETFDGRDIMIPNEEFITQRVISWTHTDHYARIDIPITITYDSDIALARSLMIASAEAHPRRFTTRPCFCIINNFVDRGVELNLQFWIADVADGRSGPRSDVMVAILRAFAENNIIVAAIPRDRPPEQPKPQEVAP